MTNIIIADNNIQSVKYLLNSIVNKIENQDIKTFIATSAYEIHEIDIANSVDLILLNKNLNIIDIFNCPVFYYRR